MSASLMPGLGDASLMPFVSGTNVPSGSAGGAAAFVLVGGVYQANVVFATPFPSTNYSVVFGVIAQNNVSFIPTAENIAVGGFTINLNTNNKTDLVDVTWMAVGW
jgi:hypothetical protein